MAKLGKLKRENSRAPDSQPKAVAPVLGAGAGENPTLAACIKRPRRTQDKYSASNLSSFPREIIFNILLLLPASLLQDIMRFVCKEWNAIITDPLFVRAHLLHSLSSPGTGFLVQDTDLHDAKLKQALYLHTYDATLYSSSQLQLPFQATIMGSCHGLVLLHHATIQRPLVVVNVVTKSIITLPPLLPAGVLILREPYATLAFAPSSGQYKVVYVTFVSNDEQESYINPSRLGRVMAKFEVKVMVCTLAVDKTWRAIDDCKGITMNMDAKDTLLTRPISSAGGYIYWLYEPYDNGFALDIDAETMHQFTRPKDFVKKKGIFINNVLMDTGVGMVHRQSPAKCWKIWEMIDPKTSTWTRVMDFDAASMYSIVNRHFNPFTVGRCVPILISFKTGEVWLHSDVNWKYELFCYNWKTGKVWSAPYKWPEGVVDLPHFHVNSLLSLKNL